MVKTHGHSQKGGKYYAEYCAWRSMRNRCVNPDHESYPNYGGRGIKVCDRWNPDEGGTFHNFIKDLGPRPSKQYSLERIDNDGSYEPANCKWATRSEQQFNQRKTRAIHNFSTEELVAELKRRNHLWIEAS